MSPLSSVVQLFSWPVQALVCAFIAGYAYKYVKRRGTNPRGLPLPPGPPRLPIFGNLLQFSPTRPWLLYHEWAKKYGDVVYLEAMGQPMLILNTLPHVFELLEKRSANYSDRPEVPAFRIMNFTWLWGLMSYTPEWRAHRKEFHQHFNQHEIPKYHPILEQQMEAFLRRLHANPRNFSRDTQYLLGSSIMQIAYGSSDLEYNKQLVDQAEVVMRGFAEVSVPGKYLVNTFPILEHVPSWMPGTAWKKKFAEFAASVEIVRSRPFRDAQLRAERGQQSDFANVVDHLIENLPDKSDPDYLRQEEIARNTSAMAYNAGADTTNSSGQALYIALAMHPEVQERARKQVEAVIGPMRLPKPSDLAAMPYIKALIKELSRWHSVAPLAVPHVARDEDEYMGYYIPKGTIVMASSWAIMHDPEVFDNPFEFRPERYLTKDGELNPLILDPEMAAFGYGRRICPGLNLSNEALQFLVASLVTVFDIKPAKDERGDPIPPKLEVSSDLFVKPTPFEVEIVPRSAEHSALITDF